MISGGNEANVRVTGLAAKDGNYLGEYNSLISLAAAECGDVFSATASPTLSKQETVTHLYESIQDETRSGRPTRFPWMSFAQFVPRLLVVFVRLCYVSIRFRVRWLPENSVYFRSWLEPRCVQGEVLIDEHFRKVSLDMERSENVVVAFQPCDYSLLNGFSRLNKKRNYIVHIGLLSIYDIIKLMFDYVFNAHLTVSGHFNLQSLDITKAINRSLLLDYLQMRSFTAYQEKYVCRNLIRYKLKAFIYVFENQSWEKACCSVLKVQGVPLIGCQGSGFSPVFLNFFPTKLDANHQPMPDVILTVGDLFTRYLLEHGNYKIPIRTFAAPRFPYPNDGIRYVLAKPNPALLKKVLYAFPVHVSQYPEILNDLVNVFESTGIAVDLKLHPQFRPERIAGFNKLPDTFRVVDRVDMDCLSNTYDCVLFNDNSFGIESLIMGVKSYQYDRAGCFDDERFFYFDLWDPHLDYDGLLTLRDQLSNGSYSKGYDIYKAARYINTMYRPYTGDLSELIACIAPV
jgi:hypothetical protein